MAKQPSVAPELDGPAPDLLHTIYRTAVRARGALALHACIVNGLRLNLAAHPGAVVAGSAVIIIWSWVIGWHNQRPASRTWAWMGADLAVTLAVVLTSGWMLGGSLLRASFFGVGCYWIVAPAAMVAIWRGPWLGTACGMAIGLAHFLQAPSLAPRAWTDVLLLAAIPYFVGFLVNTLNESITERDLNFATAAALTERERLNRIVHDGVLQLLAMVAREGSELGPRGQMLAMLARKQEDQLRSTLQDKSVDVAAGGHLDASLTDLTTMLERHQGPRVTVSTMAGELNMETSRAKEVDRVITEVLSNVAKHAGPDARAWLLLEQEHSGEVLISVRDDGVGMNRQTLQQAADAGRLGVKESIVGRVLDLGGISTLHSEVGHGTEWEFRIPLSATNPIDRSGESFEV